MYWVQCHTCGWTYQIVTPYAFIPFQVVGDYYVCNACYEDGDW